MLTEVFLSLIVTSAVGLILALARMCYKSKCESVDCFCIKIKRAVILEDEEHKFDVENGVIKKDSIEL
jgi:hypothetical protein